MLARWESVLSRLAPDPMQLAGELDWVAKLRLLKGYRERDGLDWDSSRLQLVDLQYSDVRPEKGLYHRLVSRGAMQTLLPDGAAQSAIVDAARRTPGRSSAASACAATARPSPPRRGIRSSSTSGASRWSGCRCSSRCAARRAHVGELLDRCPTAPRSSRRWSVRGKAVRR